MFGKGKQNGLTREAVLQALGTVQEPELHRDLVSLDMIHDLDVEGGRVREEILLSITSNDWATLSKLQKICRGLIKPTQFKQDEK